MPYRARRIPVLEGLRETNRMPPVDHGAQNRAAQLESWWPEALRMLDDGASIREIARRLQTEPRRIRRALARTGVRAHGTDLYGAGLPELSAQRERLGRQPDGIIAKLAGVTPEAVAGERRRLKIPAFVQRPQEPLPTVAPVVSPAPVALPAAPELSVDDEDWIRGPRREKRERQRINADALTVVRRPTRADGAPPAGRPLLRPTFTPGEARAPSPPGETRPLGELGVPLRPPGSVRVVRDARALGDARPLGDARFTGEGRSPPAISVAPQSGDGAPRPIRGREFFWDDRKAEIEALLDAPRHQRDGRKRIVRADGPRLSPIESEERPTRERVRSDAPAWRSITPPPAAVPSTSARPASAESARPAAPPSARSASPDGARPAALPSVPSDATPRVRSPVVAQRALSSGPPVASPPVVPRVTTAPAPGRTNAPSTPPAQAQLFPSRAPGGPAAPWPGASAVELPVASPTASPAPSSAASRADVRPVERWLVLISGADSGLVLEAPDVAAAAARLTTMLPAFMLEDVGLTRVA